MKLSELQKKDIVSIRDGKKIGKIIDVEFEMRKQAIELMEKDKKYNNTNKKTYDPIL